MQAMEISRTGLDVEWRRLQLIAENLANVSTVRTADGAAYQAQELMSGPQVDFDTYLSGKPSSEQLTGVQIYGVATNQGTRMVHEPGNPQADADGFVVYPAIDQAVEMTLMVKTARAYQSNIVAMNAAREMYSRALELGGKS